MNRYTERGRKREREGMGIKSGENGRSREVDKEKNRRGKREREETARATRQVESYRQIAIDDRLVGNCPWQQESAAEKEGKLG